MNLTKKKCTTIYALNGAEVMIQHSCIFFQSSANASFLNIISAYSTLLLTRTYTKQELTQSHTEKQYTIVENENLCQLNYELF